MKKTGNIDKFYYCSFPMQAILVTCDDHNKTNAITIAWHTPISKNPPLYGLSIAPKRYSHKLILESKEFVINFLPYEYTKNIHYCGTRTGKGKDKITDAELALENSDSVKTKRIKQAYSHLECKLYDNISLGDHTLIIGEIQKAVIDEKAYENDVLKNKEIKPTYYLGNNMYTRIDDSITEF
jgi:flavin reductase (DIM6/NTAB) family NADH-FMN oxidoreductase RutF